MIDFIRRNYRHFNAGALRRATEAYIDHINNDGKMFFAMAGAMSSAELGISLAPLIRNNKIHAISCTGANLEESVFRLIGNDYYEDLPDYRYFDKEIDEDLCKNGKRRITDMVFHENSVVDRIAPLLMDKWLKALANNKRYFPHEYFYQVFKSDEFLPLVQGELSDCWLLEAAKKDLPIFVAGWEDSTIGNYFAARCKDREIDHIILKTGIEYMMQLYDTYEELSSCSNGLGFFQIGGGISGDFPICVVPSLKLDLDRNPRQWEYFCQISDSVTSYGSYSGAPPNEKITWEKLNVNTPMFVIESDATIVFPIMASAILES
ncbi:MAG: deoxyhypusine synthase family protein [Candidatus Pacebacteria bacterium]|nr:deoxyhypusine synthase family protein [Candidatus Paceibacterota bacterium]